MEKRSLPRKTLGVFVAGALRRLQTRWAVCERCKLTHARSEAHDCVWHGFRTRYKASNGRIEACVCGCEKPAAAPGAFGVLMRDHVGIRYGVEE